MFYKPTSPLITRERYRMRTVLLSSKTLRGPRDVVACTDLPLKNVFKIAQRALMFVLTQCEAQHFTLYKIQDIVERCETSDVSLGECFGERTRFLTVTADIKQMFTNLPNTETLRAVRWALQRVCEVKRRFQYVRVPLDKMTPLLKREIK